MISEIAIYHPQWPGNFQELLRLWRVFNEEGAESASSKIKNKKDRDFYNLLCLSGSRTPRIYFGNEFCEHCIPHVDELEEVITSCRDIGFPLTFLTPPCCDAKLQRLTRLFDLVEKLSSRAEVVVNDWGVLETLRTHYLGLKPVLGRLMNKFLRDPRLTPRLLSPGAPLEALKVLQECSLSMQAFQELIKSYGIDRVELDYLYQRIGIDFHAFFLRPSLYIPFGYVTTGRICQFGNLNIPIEFKFGIREACNKPCRNLEATLLDPQGEPGGVYKYFQRGNTIFYKLDDPMISEAVIWAHLNQARLVYQPELPF